MSFKYLAYDLSRGDEEVSAPTVDRRLLRDVDNPFHLNATDFQKLYRLTPDLAEYLIYQLDNQIRGSRITAISTEKQVLAAHSETTPAFNTRSHCRALKFCTAFTNIMNHSHPHTIFIHFDKERVKNSFDVEVNISQFQSRNMLTAFCVAAARAKQLYGDSAFDDISSPIVVQSIQTDGKTFHFGIFQLNTLRLDELEGPKNYWFHMKNQDLFQQRGNASGTSVLEGFNMDVFRYVYAFYSNL